VARMEEARGVYRVLVGRSEIVSSIVLSMVTP